MVVPPIDAVDLQLIRSVAEELTRFRADLCSPNNVKCKWRKHIIPEIINSTGFSPCIIADCKESTWGRTSNPGTALLIRKIKYDLYTYIYLGGFPHKKCLLLQMK